MEQYRRISSEQVGHLFPTIFMDDGKLTQQSGFDGKIKVWSMQTKTCVATLSETDKAVWSVKWLPKTGKTEAFATVGENCSIAFYREATG